MKNLQNFKNPINWLIDKITDTTIKYQNSLKRIQMIFWPNTAAVEILSFLYSNICQVYEAFKK